MLKLYKITLIFVCLIFTLTSFAAEEEDTGTEENELNTWTAYLFGGMTAPSETRGDLKTSSGALVGTISSKGKSKPIVGFEVKKRITPVFSSSAIFQWTQYGYESGVASDTHVGILWMPKVSAATETREFWVGLGCRLVIYNNWCSICHKWNRNRILH